MSTFVVAEPAAVDLLPDRRRLALRLALVAGVLAALVLAVSSLPGLAAVRERLSDASPGWLAVAGVLQICSCLAFVAAFARRTVAFYVLTSSVNFFTAVVAGLALAVGGGALLWTLGPAAAAALVICAVLALPRLVSRERPRAGRAGRALAALSAGIGDAVRLARAGHPLILAGAIGFMAFDLLALGAAFAALGALPPIGVLALAYVVGQLGGLIPLPGGVGGADGGLIAAFALYGTPLGTAAAAVLAYRAFQLGLPALLGALAVVRLPRVLERAPDVGALCEARGVVAA